MTTLPDLEPAAIDWQRVDDALVSCAGLLKTLCRNEIGGTCAAELEYVRSALAARSTPEAGKAVDEPLVETVWRELARRCFTTPGKDAVRYALTAALASVPAPSGAAESVAWTDEQIVELAVAHSNYREGADLEVISHARIIEFARHLIGNPSCLEPCDCGETTAAQCSCRLYDDQQPMASEAGEMTAAEDVLAWLIIEKIGVPDDVSYTPHQAQKIIENALNDAANAHEWATRWQSVAETICTVLGLGLIDPPDIVEAIRAKFTAAETEATSLRRKLEETIRDRDEKIARALNQADIEAERAGNALNDLESAERKLETARKALAGVISARDKAAMAEARLVLRTLSGASE